MSRMLVLLLVEAGAGLGGTCLFEGCIPSKILRESARRLLDVRRAQEFGLQIPAGEIGVDWGAVMKRKAAILRGRADGSVAARGDARVCARFLFAAILGLRGLARTGCGRGELSAVAREALRSLD